MPLHAAKYCSIVLQSAVAYTACGATRGARGDISQRAQNFGGAKLRSECYVLITKCQMSADANKCSTIYKMSNNAFRNQG